jgi:hypothetical protein
MASALHKIKNQGNEAPRALEKLSGHVNDSIHKLIAQLRIPSWANMPRRAFPSSWTLSQTRKARKKLPYNSFKFYTHLCHSSVSARSGEPISAAKRAKTTIPLSVEKLGKIGLALVVDILLADMQISYRDIQARSSGLMESFHEAMSDPPKLLIWPSDRNWP